MSYAIPGLGPCLYRARDGVSDLAAIITLIEYLDSEDGIAFCSLTIFGPSQPPQFYTRICFDPNANQETARPGTCYYP